MLRIGIVAGEPSGDLLGADLIRAFRAQGLNLVVEGIAGPQLLAQGCISLAPMDKLAIMGIGDILAKLPELLALRRRLRQYFLAHPPDVFVGVDSPDFNLALEKKLRQSSIRCVHYVSPSIWAWRRYRLKKIAKSVDLMLTLWPFEAHYYQQQRIPVQFVGHPFADQIPLLAGDPLAARQQLGVSQDRPLIALLPGSRENEIRHLGPLFIETAQYCLQHMPHLLFMAPMATEACRQQFMALLDTLAPQLNIHVYLGQSLKVMTAADAVVLASGSATFEAMLLKKPMVVAYRMSKASYFIARLLVQVSHIALPNLLADRRLVPEFVQTAATVENLAQATLAWLADPKAVQRLQVEFTHLHQQLCRNASTQAVQAILRLLSRST